MGEFFGKIVVVFLLAAVAFLPYKTKATDFSSLNFKIKDPVIIPSAGFSTSSSFQLWGSMGQEAIGTSSALGFGLKSGFLYFPAPTVPTSPTSAIPGFFVIGGGITLEKLMKKCDFNEDEKCNIVDLSIILFYYDKTGPEISRYDLNKNKRVDFPDISILLYYWTEFA